MSSLSAKPLVLVTGASGFVGAHVFARLLDSGYRVRGTLRSLSKAPYFYKRYPNHETDISFVEVPDMQVQGAMDNAMSDVDYVCHIASPYFTISTNPMKELIEPAVNGTKNVMTSALKSPTLKRLTIMSSFAAVVDLSKGARPGYTYTSDEWDPMTLEQALKDGVMGYHYSKTQAERTAWDMWREAKPSWDLVTFNPPMVYGPPIQEVNLTKGLDGLNTSVKRLTLGIMGKDPNFAPKVSTPGLPAWCDVRDVAEAHQRALGLPKGVSERFILCSGVNNYEEGLAGLRAKGEKGLGEVGAVCDPKNHFALDASKAREMLGVKFHSIQQTVEDTWERVKELGLVQ